MGAAVGVSRETVRHWQTGRNRPYPAAGKRLSLILGEPLEDLLAPANNNGPTS
jgi:DNA-binding transcriptional regulator YiaG